MDSGSTQDATLQYNVTDNPFYQLHQLLAKQQVWFHDLERLNLELVRFTKGGTANQIRQASNEIRKANLNLADLDLEIADLKQAIKERGNAAVAEGARAVQAMYKAVA